MVRVITQETYDEVVKENMDEFEMSPQEAIEEAVAQFEAQGVDLSNIIKDLALGSDDKPLVSTTLIRLKDLCKEEEEFDQEAVLKELTLLKSECNKDLARKVRAGKEGAYKTLIDQLSKKQKVFAQELCEKDKKLIVALLLTLKELMDGQPDLLDSKGVDIIKNILDNVDNEDILIATLQWTSVCCIKHENNRQRIFAKNIGENLKLLLKATENEKLLAETARVSRRLALDDDIRVEFGKAHDHARELGAMMLEPVAELLKENTHPALASELMQTLSALCVRNELCALAAVSGVQALFDLLARADDVATATRAVQLITVLAGNDDVKREFVKSGIVPVVVSVLFRHAKDPTASGSTLKCISALSLREPTHGLEFINNGAPEAVVQSMKIHPNNVKVQKNACWAIRNMVARCREEKHKFHELGVEELLNLAYQKFDKDFGYDIKSALVDLECDVKLDEQWKGKGVQLEL